MAEGEIVTGDGGSGGQQQPSLPAQQPSNNAMLNSNAAVSPDGVISWTASEFIAHEKSPGWYGMLAIATVIIAAIVYISTRDIISTVVVIIAAVAFAVIGGRKPRQLQYQLTNTGVIIGHKQLSYSAFKSFSVVPEGAFSSIVFRPLKRFAPLTTIYYAPDDEDRIVGLISDHLPFEEYKPDAVDNMMRRIRF